MVKSVHKGKKLPPGQFCIVLHNFNALKEAPRFFDMFDPQFQAGSSKMSSL